MLFVSYTIKENNSGISIMLLVFEKGGQVWSMKVVNVCNYVTEAGSVLFGCFPLSV